MGKGDLILIETPGGGGWGTLDTEDECIGTEGGFVGNIEWERRGSLYERERLQASF
jgi:N-methylhydantoinase B/oxoprolinase/acetone carboxylase alpha subunit